MKKRIFALLTFAALLATGCVEHEEVAFEGIIVGTRACTGMVMDSNTGFFVALSSPDSIGGRLTATNGEVMDNVVVLYEPPILLYVGDTIHGTFYFDDKYSKANCNLVWDEMNVPEGVILRVVVD